MTRVLRDSRNLPLNSLSQKTWGHHPFDDGPENLFSLMARPPSPGCASPYRYGANSYDDANKLPGPHDPRRSAVRDGDAQNFDRHEATRMGSLPSISQINTNAKQNKSCLSTQIPHRPSSGPLCASFLNTTRATWRQPFDNRAIGFALA